MKINLNYTPSSFRGNTIKELAHTTNNQPITIYNSQQAQLKEESCSPDIFNNLNFSYVKDPISEIENCSGIIIKQYPDNYKFINGCESCNKYYIFGISDNNYKYLFKCEENINCFNNYLCPISNKKINFNLIHIDSNLSSSGIKVGSIIKPYKCSCFCICRPEFILNLEDSNETVGKIKEYYSCFENSYRVINIKNQSRYLVKANCCQCGLFCSNSICGQNSDVSFNIMEPLTEEVLGIICKQKKGDKKNGEESYEIKFPKNANSNDKLLLTALGIMIDYQYFEIDPRKFKDIINNNLSE